MYVRRSDTAGVVPRRHHAGAATIALAALLLSACGSGGDDDPRAAGATASGGVPAAAESTGATTPGGDSAAAEETADVDVDVVQTDEPATDASLVVTYAEWVAGSGAIEGSAFVQGLVETGGTCTLTAGRGGSEQSGAAVDAEAGPSTTDCGALSVALPDGSSGTWDVTVSYASGSTELTSDEVQVRVP